MWPDPFSFVLGAEKRPQDKRKKAWPRKTKSGLANFFQLYLTPSAHCLTLKFIPCSLHFGALIKAGPYHYIQHFYSLIAP